VGPFFFGPPFYYESLINLDYVSINFKFIVFIVYKMTRFFFSNEFALQSDRKIKTPSSIKIPITSEKDLYIIFFRLKKVEILSDVIGKSQTLLGTTNYNTTQSQVFVWQPPDIFMLSTY